MKIYICNDMNFEVLRECTPKKTWKIVLKRDMSGKNLLDDVW